MLKRRWRVRSSDIAARCREIALRVEISGEWGELGDTLREAAAEVERLRLSKSEVEALIEASLEMQSLHCMETDRSWTLRNLLARQGGDS